MQWLFERSARASHKNGSISVERSWGAYRVSVDGCGQTTGYTNAMWADAFKRLHLKSPRVLLLGLGAAGSVPLLHKRFPGCEITAVEYDPAMTALARELGLHRPFPFPKVLEGDAADIARTLTDTFDIIIIDLFNGPEPSALSTDRAFLEALEKRLDKNGVLLINVYKKPEYLAAARALFGKSDEWKFRQNNLGAFTRLPAQFAPPECWPEYVESALPPNICAREEVGNPRAGGPCGVRWSLWPITFEQYTGDKEPDLAAARSGALARNRAVMWRRVRRTDVPAGWRALSKHPWRVDGFVELRAGEDYKAGWQKQPRRELRLWEENFLDKMHRIEKISIEEYSRAFKKSTVKKKAGDRAIEILERKYATQLGREHMELWGVRNIATGEVVAGITLRFSPTFNSATYECPFILPEAKKIYAMTALIDLWFKESIKRGISLLVFNSFWNPGEPKSWKAFSLFKSHFGPTYVAYPPTLFKFVRGKMF